MLRNSNRRPVALSTIVKLYHRAVNIRPIPAANAINWAVSASTDVVRAFDCTHLADSFTAPCTAADILSPTVTIAGSGGFLRYLTTLSDMSRVQLSTLHYTMPKFYKTYKILSTKVTLTFRPNFYPDYYTNSNGIVTPLYAFIAYFVDKEFATSIARLRGNLFYNAIRHHRMVKMMPLPLTNAVGNEGSTRILSYGINHRKTVPMKVLYDVTNTLPTAQTGDIYGSTPWISGYAGATPMALNRQDIICIVGLMNEEDSVLVTPLNNQNPTFTIDVAHKVLFREPHATTEIMADFGDPDQNENL